VAACVQLSLSSLQVFLTAYKYSNVKLNTNLMYYYKYVYYYFVPDMDVKYCDQLAYVRSRISIN